jgi:hypothetical protein
VLYLNGSLMARRILDTTPVPLTTAAGTVPVLQNLGPDPIYIATTAAACNQDGALVLNPGEGYELPRPLGRGRVLWVCSAGTSDLRWLSL